MKKYIIPRSVLGLALCLILLFSLTACGSRASAGKAPSSGQLITIDGESVDGEIFEGNSLTVLNVWATWCPPCVAELPHLQAVSETFKDQGVEIIGLMQDGVNSELEPVDEAIDLGKALLDQAGASYRVLLPDAELTEQFISQMQYFPTTFFLDAEGLVVETVIGSNDTEGWELTINEVLKKIAK